MICQYIYFKISRPLMLLPTGYYIIRFYGENNSMYFWISIIRFMNTQYSSFFSECKFCLIKWMLRSRRTVQFPTFPPFLRRGYNFEISYMLSWTPRPFRNGVYFFLSKLPGFEKGGKFSNGGVSFPKSVLNNVANMYCKNEQCLKPLPSYVQKTFKIIWQLIGIVVEFCTVACTLFCLCDS